MRLGTLLVMALPTASACVIYTTRYEDAPPPPGTGAPARPRPRAHQQEPPGAPPRAQPSPAPAGQPGMPGPMPGRVQAQPPLSLVAQPPLEPIPVTPGEPAMMPEGAANGRPPRFNPSAPPGYWIWVGPRSGWRLRTTTAGGAHLFRGRIKGATSEVTNVHPSRTEFRDRIRRLADGSWEFSFRTAGHADGLTFVTRDNGCVAFDLQVDGGPQPKRIFVGAGETQPPGNFFMVCPKGTSPSAKPGLPRLRIPAPPTTPHP